MKVKRSYLLTIVMAILLIVMLASMAVADDGAMFRRNVSKTPDQVTERANLMQMTFYVPAQTSEGILGIPIEYYDGADTPALVETREFAKPLVAVYVDALLEEELEGLSGILSGAGYGAHDAHAAVSLDDGATWKRTNLSNSADLSSFILADGHEYPGDAHNMTFTIAGDKVLVGWISKYCDGGSPTYTFTEEDIDALQTAFVLPDLYVHDIWGVAGSQKSVDYTGQGYPEVGEIPYSCVWSARGQLLPVELDDTGTMGYDIVWAKPERLTSGRRDANRLEMNADGAAGFMMTWQEDPEGLRPGQGLGPGEGWSGAVVNQQTDLWYSFIALDDFVMVKSDDTDEATAVDIAVYEGETMPKVAVPMAMPIRLTDNKKCMTAKGTDNTESQQFPYCYIDFDDMDPYSATVLPVGWDEDTFTRSEVSTFCTLTVPWTNPSGTTLELCSTEDGRVLGGRVGASRPRVNVQPYNSLFIVDDGDDTTEYDSAIVIMGAEESKALGEGSTEEDVEPADIGKNMWYYTFDLLNPQILMQGGMINQPAQCNPYDVEVGECTLNDFMMLEDPIYEENEFYETEIARRFSHMSQPIHQFGPAGISSVLIVKQGILNQGGPADIFLRLTQVPDDVVWEDCELDGDDTTTEQCLPEGYNPYAYENLVCENLEGESEWVYLPNDVDDTRDGTVEFNPRYIQGLCTSNMINVSGTSIVSCDGNLGDCADQFPWDGVEDGTSFPKVTEWSQCGPNYNGTFPEGCTEEEITLDDQSWDNPYDVAKGHRGYIDGDFIMMMYAWSPNWQANSVGNDHYNLYARRSFDGGQTWTTLPEDFLDTVEYPEDVVVTADGNETCENYKNGEDINIDCTIYGEGEFEQARNLSQLIGNKVTVLDPRYTPTGGIKMLPITDLKETNFEGYDDDNFRDPSKFFIVYETGDNTTVAEGEAIPMDLFYSRATDWGDEYDLIEYYNSGTGVSTMGFDWLEHDHDDLSGEAANLANNGGNFYYAIWNQWQEDEHENVSESDAIFRRIMYLEDEEQEAAPIVSILYISHTMADYDDDLLFVGSARDGDHIDGLPHEDIGGVLWTDTFEGVTTTLGEEKQLNMPARNLQPGWHTISFSAKDKGGRWSPGATSDIWIVEELHQVYLPIALK